MEPEGHRLTDQDLLYDANDLTTHAVIVAMTGSGKTGLGIDLIEEAALDGVPVLAIDPKGDLTNLALLFNEVVAWTRAQRGTTSLRALPYVDEPMGLMPPVAQPPPRSRC